MTTANASDTCTTREAARRLGVSLRTVQLWTESGVLDAWKTPGGHRRVLNSAVDRLIGAGWLPPLLDPIWDTSPLLDDTTKGGKLIADFSGYRARPALSSLLAWASYWGIVILAWRRSARD